MSIAAVIPALVLLVAIVAVLVDYATTRMREIDRRRAIENSRTARKENL